MNRLVFLMAMLSMLVLTGCIGSLSNESVIGVVDTARVFRDSDAGKEGFKYLETVQAEMQAKLNILQMKLKKDPENKKVAQKLQETYLSFQQRIGAEQQKVITLLNDASQRVLDSYRAKNSLLIIISSEATLSYGEAVDITDGVIEELNKEKIEFKFNAAAVVAPASKVKEVVVEDKKEAKKEDKAKKSKDKSKKDKKKD